MPSSQTKPRKEISDHTDMEFALIPRTDVKVSRVGLGTWAIGGWMWGGSEEKDSIATIHHALDRDITLIDTAPVYGFGRSEEIVGKALAGGRRARAVIATKVALEWHDGKITRNASRKRIMQEIEDSLRRLNTDRIDIYQIHWPDPKTPIEETAGAMQELLQQGKIRAIGVSNFSVAQIETFRKTAPVHVVQPPYNLFEREIDAELLPYCHANQIATLGYGALCRGLLAGKISRDTQFHGDDLRRNDPKFKPPRFAQYLAAVAKLDRFAEQRYGKRVIDLAVRWMLDQGITSALWGARHPAQLDPVREVFGWSIDAQAKEEIDRILKETVTDPVGPEFMAPPERS